MSLLGRALAIVLAGAAAAETQSIDLIEEELENVRRSVFELGPFYVTPSLRVATGYDSNTLSSPTGESDITALVGPGVRLAVPFGARAFFDLYEEVDVVYYREQVDLRRFFDVTRVGAGLGGRRFLLGASHEFRDETVRPTSELDRPLEWRSNELLTSLTLALGWRQDLRFAYRKSSFEIREDIQDLPGALDRLNRGEDLYTLTLSRRMSAKTKAVAEGFYERFAFQDASRDGDSYGARFGFDFSPERADALTSGPWGRGFVAGQLLLGFRTMQPYDHTLVAFKGLIGLVDVTFGFGAGNRLRGTFSRDLVPSIFERNWYFVENRWGVAFTYQISRRFSVEPGVVVGKNDYPLPSEVENEAGELVGEEVFDDHARYLLTFNVHLKESWTVGVRTEYLGRESNLREFDKDRLQVSLIMNLAR